MLGFAGTGRMDALLVLRALTQFQRAQCRTCVQSHTPQHCSARTSSTPRSPHCSAPSSSLSTGGTAPSGQMEEEDRGELLDDLDDLILDLEATSASSTANVQRSRSNLVVDPPQANDSKSDSRPAVPSLALPTGEDGLLQAPRPRTDERRRSVGGGTVDDKHISIPPGCFQASSYTLP